MHNINSQFSYLNFKDFRKRTQLHYLLELKIKLIKYFFYDVRLKFNIRFLMKTRYLAKYGLLHTSVHNSCLLTGKKRFIFNYFNLNRSSLKFYISCGYIAGFRRY